MYSSFVLQLLELNIDSQFDSILQDIVLKIEPLALNDDTDDKFLFICELFYEISRSHSSIVQYTSQSFFTVLINKYKNSSSAMDNAAGSLVSSYTAHCKDLVEPHAVELMESSLHAIKNGYNEVRVSVTKKKLSCFFFTIFLAFTQQ